MCGIVGAVAKIDIVTTLLNCLQCLEYRGYDSSGIAVLEAPQVLRRLRAVGKIDNLRTALQDFPLTGKVGIVHTRWATHGAPTEANAHPHFSQNEIAVVHNGIIENYYELREELQREGYEPQSETDSEVIAHLIHKYYQITHDLLQAVHLARQRLSGMYAIAVIHVSEPNRLIGVRQGSSLVVGFGENGHFIASDCVALISVAEKFIYLQEGDLVDVFDSQVVIYDSECRLVEREPQVLHFNSDATERGAYKHYMQKEIFEQPCAVANTFAECLQQNFILNDIFGVAAKDIFPKVKRIQIVACGSSYYAGLVARYWFESIANLPCRVDIASELRYQKTVLEQGTLLVAISQSGETADTLAVVRQAREVGYLAWVAISNVAASALMREADLAFLTHAGIEIGVASTKTFTTQLVALFLLSITLGQYNGLDERRTLQLTQALKNLPAQLEQTLAFDAVLQSLAQKFINKQHALYLGRNNCYPIALEGALKMKEISYIHAEAYPAGELKHGPLALVDENMPVVVLLPKDDLVAKMESNIKEVQARRGEVIVFADSSLDCSELGDVTVIKMPEVLKEVAPIVYTLPLQLLAYHTAVQKGADVDQPRNLAKSVTVE